MVSGGPLGWDHISNWCPLPSPRLTPQLPTSSLALSLLPSSLCRPFPPATLSYLLSRFSFFLSSAQSPVTTTTTTTCNPPSPPSRTAVLHQLCRPGESGVEERRERGGFQPSEETEDRRTGKRGTMAAPSVALKTWVILQTLCLALAQVVSAQRRM